MINRIIDFSVQNKFAVLSVVALACAVGWWSMSRLPLDAIPDLSETQVIVYSHWDRSPDAVENQVTYPIVTAMLGAPHVKTVRGISDFGYSFVYVIFDDNTDVYWARARTQELLSAVQPHLPAGARTEIGPDATSVGWVFQYALVDTSGRHSLADLRSFQDWYLRYYLRSVPGVAEVAPIGGFGREFQVNLDPNRLQAYNIPISRVVDAVRGGNKDAGGRLLEFGGTEYMIRGLGYAKSIDDFAEIVLAPNENGVPIRIKDVGQVVVGPEMRRGIADLDGTGDVVSGIVLMRTGENALQVIDRVKQKLKEIEPGLPPGVKVVSVYDRSQLIRRAIGNVKETIVEIVVTVMLIILVFLWHPPSAAIPIVTIPVALLLSFIPFRMLGISANVMSMAGIAIAFGELVDASIIVVEQTHKKLEQWQKGDRRTDSREVVLNAIKEVAGPTFFALLVLAISFLPVLTLEAEEGRMFKPLAYTKTLAMLVAAVLAITLDPALRMLLTRTKEFDFRPRWLCRVANAALISTIRPEETHPISRMLMTVYEPTVRWTLRNKWIVLSAAAILLSITIPVFGKLGSEFMPTLDEGTVLYMPSTMPGISLGEVQRLLQLTDRRLKQFPEVDRVLGKAGRAETSTDPAPLSMLETVITLKPRSEWRKVHTWYSSWAPEWAQVIFRHVTPDTISTEQLLAEFNSALQVPGVSNSWTMPIKGRIDMLTTGIRTPVGLKISGADLNRIQQIGTNVEELLQTIRGTRGVFAERTAEGHFLDLKWKRAELARYGVNLEDAQMAVENAIGGDDITTAVIGRERYPVSVRYARDYRSDFTALGRVLVPASGGRQIALSELADVGASSGPAMIRNENGLATGYVYVDIGDRDPDSYVNDANALLRSALVLPPGYSLAWSGQYEAMQRVRKHLTYVVPLTCALVLLLVFFNTKSIPKTLIVLLAVPFSAIGAIWLLYLCGYKMSVCVWIGIIALLGVDAETGVFMLLYLDLAHGEASRAGRLNSIFELREAIVAGAAKRLRPKFMTFATMCIGLFPILWSTGTGAEIMKRIAMPMVGGIFTSFALELLVYPVIYEIWKSKELNSHSAVTEDTCQQSFAATS